MVVDRHGKITLGGVLPDDVLVEEILDLRRLQQVLPAERSRRTLVPLGEKVVVLQNLVAVLDALVADVGAVGPWNISSTSSRRAPQNEQQSLGLSPPWRPLCRFCVIVFTFGEHFVDQPVVAGFAGRKPVVAVGVALDLLDRDARMGRKNLVQLALGLRESRAP